MIITIDLEKETTAVGFAKLNNIPYATVNTWISRKKIKFRRIEALKIVLVEIHQEVLPYSMYMKNKSKS